MATNEYGLYVDRRHIKYSAWSRWSWTLVLSPQKFVMIHRATAPMYPLQCPTWSGPTLMHTTSSELPPDPLKHTVLIVGFNIQLFWAIDFGGLCLNHHQPFPIQNLVDSYLSQALQPPSHSHTSGWAPWGCRPSQRMQRSPDFVWLTWMGLDSQPATRPNLTPIKISLIIEIWALTLTIFNLQLIKELNSHMRASDLRQVKEWGLSFLVRASRSSYVIQRKTIIWLGHTMWTGQSRQEGKRWWHLEQYGQTDYQHYVWEIH